MMDEPELTVLPEVVGSALGRSVPYGGRTGILDGTRSSEIIGKLNRESVPFRR